MILWHGTTRKRAERIVRDGPDPRVREKAGLRADEDFTLSVPEGPHLLGTPFEYAYGKDALFPEEAGPVLLIIDVPDSILMLASDDQVPVRWGTVQFEEGWGLEELVAAWATLIKEIRSLP